MVAFIQFFEHSSVSYGWAKLTAIKLGTVQAIVLKLGLLREKIYVYRKNHYFEKGEFVWVRKSIRRDRLNRNSVLSVKSHIEERQSSVQSVIRNVRN